MVLWVSYWVVEYLSRSVLGILMQAYLIGKWALWSCHGMAWVTVGQIFKQCNHRNLRTRRMMHLCIQDEQIGRSAPADMARLPHLTNKNIAFIT
jgi:hypothetical protein